MRMSLSLRAIICASCAHLASAQLRLPFSRQVKHAPSSTVTERDTTPLSVGVWSGEYAYIVNVTVGTPAQPMSLLLSPSSPQTWVIDVTTMECSDYESEDVSYCNWGAYNSLRSSTYSYDPRTQDDDDNDVYGSDDDEGSFYISDVDGTYASGSYFKDVFTLGDTRINNISLALVNETNTFIGVLGLGYNESSTVPNLPDLLVSQELANTPAYSLWMDDEAATTGSVLFGAIDTAKFSGTLSRLQSNQYVPSSSSSYADASDGFPFTVDLYSINGTNNDTSLQKIDSYQLPMTVNLSPAAAYSQFPTSLANQIWEMVGATYISDYDLAIIPCSASGAANFFTFGLGNWDGPVLTATMADLVIPQNDTELSAYFYDEEDTADMCIFGIQNSSTYSSLDYETTLGSNLLRRTYAVFDLANNEVAVAPVKFGVTTENIVAFPSYGAAAPSATQVCAPQGCTTSVSNPFSTSTSGPTESGSGGSGSSSSGNDGNDGDVGSSGNGLPSGILSLGAILGIGFGVGFGVLLLVGVALFIFIRRRRQARQAALAKGNATSASDLGDPEEQTRQPMQQTAPTRDGFLAPPMPTRPAPTAQAQPTNVPNIEVTPATHAADEVGESSKGKQPATS